MKNISKFKVKIVLLCSLFTIHWSLSYAQTGITINNPTSTISSSTGKISLSTDSAITTGPIYGGKLFLGSSNQFQVNGSGNLIKINGVTSSWPSSQGASNTLLSNDGSGNFSWVTPASFSLWQVISGTSNIQYTSGYFSGNYSIINDSLKTPKILPLDGDSTIRIGNNGFCFITHKPYSCLPDEIGVGYNGILSIIDTSKSGPSKNNVRVGIGTFTPNAALQIYSTMSTKCSSVALEFCITNATTNNNVFTVDNGGNTFIPTGKMSIGVVSTDMPGSYRLYVKGGILTEHCRVAKDSTTDWSDYVFSDTYKLPALDSLENYIKQNHHLQDIPSTEDVTKNGIDLAQMDAQLLKKIEELTLYVIQLQKDNAELKKEVEAIKK